MSGLGQAPSRQVCSICSVEKSISEFSRRGGDRPGHSTQCKRCLLDKRVAAKRVPIRSKESAARILSEGTIPVPFSGCLVWTGAWGNFGYGCLTFEGAPRRAHRLSYEVNIGPIENGLAVLHRCDVPACVNPDHLFLGTAGDNVRDCVSKGRHRPNPVWLVPRTKEATAKTSATASDGRRKGERCNTAKLSEREVLEIRLDPRTGRELGAQYGVSITTIQGIKTRKIWRHI